MITWIKTQSYLKCATLLLAIFVAYSATMFVPYQYGNVYGPVAVYALGSRFWTKDIHFTKYESVMILLVFIFDIILHSI